MISAPPPEREAERLAALNQCGVLDTAPEAAFDHIAQLASQLCNTPIALVSLVDESRQWFKARVGLAATETPRNVSFCAHAILAPQEPFIVPDATLDPRFADNPLVLGSPFVRFYAGVPLTLESGIAVGSLCVIDHVPRELSTAQLKALQLLAKQIVNELSLRRQLLQSRRSDASRRSIPDLTATLGEDEAVPPASLLHGTLPVALGQRVEGRYRVSRVLGVGGMGVVAAAYDDVRKCDVALKFMLREAFENAAAVQRFVREARALQRVVNDHVARLLDVGNLPDGVPYIVMELLHGEDLERKLRRVRTLDEPEAVDVVMQAALGLQSVHSQGVLHRDLKPANLFLCAGDGSTQVKLLDFGISKLWSNELGATLTALTTVRSTIGSPHYMSPEQMMEPDMADQRTDIWSLGVILYQALCGTLPFDASSYPAVCVQVITGELQPAHVRNPRVSRSVSEVVTQCLQKDRAQRPATMDALIEALRSAR